MFDLLDMCVKYLLAFLLLFNMDLSIVPSPEDSLAFFDNITIEDIANIENDIECSNNNSADLLNDRFTEDKLINGLYTRALTIPKGAFLTGRVHKNDYVDIMISGDMTIKSFLADGSVEDTNRYRSFRFMQGKAGRKRVGIAHETTLWVTVDKTNVTNIESALNDISYLDIPSFVSKV